MKKLLAKLTAVIISLVLCFAFTLPALAEENEVEVKEHSLTFEMPAGFTALDSSNAAKNEEAVENFGYTGYSFNSYLGQNNILLFASNTDGTQICRKCWETDFSKEIADLGVLSEDTLASVASQIITLKGATYKISKVNGMRVFEVRKTDTDSGGNFFSVQYVTIRNGKIYSLNFAFSGNESEANRDFAWETVKGLKITNKSSSSPWDVASVFEMVLIWVIIIAAAVTVVVIFISFIGDYKKRKAEAEAGTEIIFRRKK